MLVAVSGIITVSVIVATIGSIGITSGVVVAAGAAVIPETEEVATRMVSGIDGIVAGADAGIISAAVPAFVVAPHAPSEVFITPPSIIYTSVRR